METIRGKTGKKEGRSSRNKTMASLQMGIMRCLQNEEQHILEKESKGKTEKRKLKR